MSIDTEAGAVDSPETVDALAGELGAAIADTAEHERFESARRAVQHDPETQEKIEEFETLRREFMTARQAGNATQSQLAELQTTQNELHAMAKMAEFLEAQNELEARLEALNDTISAPLALDFGDNIGGCCND